MGKRDQKCKKDLDAVPGEYIDCERKIVEKSFS